MKVTVKMLYAMAARLELLERDSKEDAFHQLVYSLTNKEHVSELNQKELRKVFDELDRRIQAEENIDGMATVKQKRYINSLMERLARLDPSDVPIEKRLAGVVHTTLKITSFETEPLKWVKKAEASKLIEQLKRYIRSAEKKAKNK